MRSYHRAASRDGSAEPDPERKMGVNARSFDRAVLRRARIAPFDGAA
jgi:hypothetical protein